MQGRGTGCWGHCLDSEDQLSGLPRSLAPGSKGLFWAKVGIAVKALREMTAVKEIISQLPTPAARIRNTHVLWPWSRGQEQGSMPPSHSPCLWSVASASKQDLCFSSPLMIQL